VLVAAPPPYPEQEHPKLNISAADRDELDSWWSWWSLQDKVVALLLEPCKSEWTKGRYIPCQEFDCCSNAECNRPAWRQCFSAYLLLVRHMHTLLLRIAQQSGLYCSGSYPRACQG
jgi:hypothetical protein